MRAAILDVAPIPEGEGPGEALRNSVSLARHAEAWGYGRYWVAEHHGAAAVASSAPAVLAATVGAATRSIRVGAGGVMLLNHDPVAVADQFATLERLHPGRIDLGVGRGPQLDAPTQQALRLTGSPDDYPDKVKALRERLQPLAPADRQATPIWILGASLYSAFLAADLGLPLAFASHMTQVGMAETLAAYRRAFRPSAQAARPYVIASLQVFAADTEGAARRAASSSLIAFFEQQRGRPGPLPSPADDLAERLTPDEMASVEALDAERVVGGPERVSAALAEFARRTGADELMITADIHDHQARLRSFEIVAEAMAGLPAR